MNKNKIITSLYDQYKNTNKKLKIVCDWDEVIQACEPYALWLAKLWLAKREVRANPTSIYPAPLNSFPEYFDKFWGNNTTINNPSRVEYSSYGSRLSEWQITIAKSDYGDEVIQRQTRIKNDSNFYQTAPFLTIAEDLLKLIKEDKVEQIIFLSAYDKRKFPDGDNRKVDIFNETFRNFWIQGLKHEKRLCWLELIPFESEQKGQTKADWIKQNASDFDIVIDDNPNICKSVVENNGLNPCYTELCGKTNHHCEKCEIDITVISPYYPTIENQHHEEVVLVKNEVSDLKKEEFEHYGIK